MGVPKLRARVVMRVVCRRRRPGRVASRDKSQRRVWEEDKVFIRRTPYDVNGSSRLFLVDFGDGRGTQTIGYLGSITGKGNYLPILLV